MRGLRIMVFERGIFGLPMAWPSHYHPAHLIENLSVELRQAIVKMVGVNFSQISVL